MSWPACFYDLLPGSGNPRLSSPTVAAELRPARVLDWRQQTSGNRYAATATCDRERHRFCPLVEGVVRKALSWRAGKGAPLTLDEVEAISRIVLSRIATAWPAHCAPLLQATGALTRGTLWARWGALGDVLLDRLHEPARQQLLQLVPIQFQDGKR